MFLLFYSESMETAVIQGECTSNDRKTFTIQHYMCTGYVTEKILRE